MIYLIEGPNGSGKTTLARKFENKGFHYIHCGPPPEWGGSNAYLYYFRMLTKAASHSGHTVFDRGHIGELIYAPLLRRKSTMTLADASALNNFIKSTAGNIAVALPPYEVCRKNWEASSPHRVVTTLKQFEKSYGGFKILQQGLGLTSWDYTVDNYFKKFRKILLGG